MSKVATLEIDGKKYEFPVTIGSENEVAIDIKNLRSETGLLLLIQDTRTQEAVRVLLPFWMVKKVY